MARATLLQLLGVRSLPLSLEPGPPIVGSRAPGRDEGGRAGHGLDRRRDRRDRWALSGDPGLARATDEPQEPGRQTSAYKGTRRPGEIGNAAGAKST